ncbi:MAG: hypothetical protein AAFN59_06300 [Pseudomonadota bacterium]
MTDASNHLPLSTSPRRAHLFVEPIFTQAGILLALSLAVTLAAYAIDPRVFQGENIWLKPIKFQFALSVYLLTLAFFARWLPKGMTTGWRYRAYAGVVVFCIAGELAWIGGAAAMGTASHFNLSSPVWANLYALMGVFAVTLTSATLVYGIAIARNKTTGLDRAVKLSVVFGLILTFVLTIPAAGTMSNMAGHHIGDVVTGSRVPFMGWSGEVGDLRIAHFFATHAMHVLPLAGLGALMLPQRARVPVVIMAAITFTGFTVFTFVQALNGQPLIPIS